MSIGVTIAAIARLDANEAINIFTNWYFPFWTVSSKTVNDGSLP